MKKFNRLFAIVLIFTMIIGNISVMATESRVATVVSFEGEVKLKKAGGEKNFDPYEGMELEEGTTIITGKDSELVLTMDGTKEVKVAEKSYVTIEELVVDDEGEKTGFRLFTGKIWSKIKQKLGIGDEYEIRTPNSIMGARGTKYVVSYEFEEDHQKSKSKLTVIEGVVNAKVEKKSGQEENVSQEDKVDSFNVEAGQETELNPDEVEEQKVEIKEFALNGLDLFTIDAVLDDVKENPDEYENADQLTEDLEEIKPIVEEKEKLLEDAEEKEADEAQANDADGISYDNESVVKENTVIELKGLDLVDSSLTMTLGDAPHTLPLRYSPSNTTKKSVVWSSSDSSIISVDTSGTIKAVGVGSATVKVESPDGVLGDSCNVTVQAVSLGDISVTGVTIDGGDVSLYKGFDQHLTVTIIPSNASTQSVTWSSNNAPYVPVDATGLIEGLLVGSANITVTTDDGGFTDTIGVTVSNKPVTGVMIVEEVLGVLETETKALNAQVAPTDAEDTTVSWSSSDTSIATVNGSGDVTGVAAGTATITVTTTDGGFTDTAVVNVSKPTVAVTGFTITEATLDLKVGEEGYITPNIVPVNASNQDILWATDDGEVATVDSTGKILAVGLGDGTAIITGTTQDGDISDTVTVSVTNINVTGLNIVQSTVGMEVNDTESLTYQVLPSNATIQTVGWASDDTDVATVDGSGVITAVGAGTCTITGTTTDQSQTDTVTVNVAQPTVNVTGVGITESILNMKPGDTDTLTVDVTPSNAADQGVSFSSDNTAVATVNGSGVVTAVGVGTAKSQLLLMMVALQMPVISMLRPST